MLKAFLLLKCLNHEILEVVKKVERYLLFYFKGIYRSRKLQVLYKEALTARNVQVYSTKKNQKGGRFLGYFVDFQGQINYN